MSRLREAGLGPIVGHTTHSSSRIWIRAGDHGETDQSSSRQRTLGVAAVVEVDGTVLEPEQIQAYYFRLHRERDRTGVFEVGSQSCLKGTPSKPLKAEVHHTVRVGTLTIDDPYGDDENISSDNLAERLPDANVWITDLLALREKNAVAQFRTFADPADGVKESIAFLVGSCRYPGVLWKVKDADRIFGPMVDEARNGSARVGGDAARGPADLVLMVGDQIYADMLNRHIPIGLADTFEEFQERYLSAFGSRQMRKLLRNIPTYMILDDHEIEDNWHQDRIHKAASRRVFNLAIDAYRSYQWSHGPDSFNGRLYYRFECGGYPFFVLDTRTQRYMEVLDTCTQRSMEDGRNSLDDNHMLGRPSLGDEEPSQLDRLVKWLVDCQQEQGDRPKFVVTSSVFAPNPMNARTGRAGSVEQKAKWAEASDSWPAFPKTRRAILEAIVENKVQNTVFLSGDIHCANVAELELTGSDEAASLKAFSITSSAFYWPFPFADGEPSNFVHDSRNEEQEDTFEFGDGLTMNYKASNFTQEDNFCRVDVDQANHAIRVIPFDRDGNEIHARNWLGQSGRNLRSELDLAPW